jgi:hypothetical protein
VSLDARPACFFPDPRSIVSLNSPDLDALDKGRYSVVRGRTRKPEEKLMKTSADHEQAIDTLGAAYAAFNRGERLPSASSRSHGSSRTPGHLHQAGCGRRVAHQRLHDGLRSACSARIATLRDNTGSVTG